MRSLYLTFLIALALVSGFGLFVQSKPLDIKAQTQNLRQGQAAFVENGGQVVDEKGLPRPDVLFTLKGGGTRIFLTANSIYYQFEKVEYPEGYEPDAQKVTDLKKREELKKQIKRSTHRMTLSLKGANPSPVIIKEDQQLYTENYYLAHCPQGILGLHSYSRIILKDVYPGIDWIIYSNADEGSGITYDFLVHPGADPENIRLEIKDADAVAIAQNGELILKNRLGTVTENAPVSYCGSEKIATRFVQKENGIAFELSGYDHNLDLRIDPTVIWATYYGGSVKDISYGMATDYAGNVFLTGYTESTSGIAASGFQMNYGGNSDAFLVKFDNAGNRIWATYYGGNQLEYGYDCATDRNGNVYCVGYTLSQFLGTPGVFQQYLNAGADAFVVKFDSSGTRKWCSYFGAGKGDMANQCATDPAGNIYFSGITSSTNLACNGFQSSSGGGVQDAFLAKFDAAGNRIWATYLGGSDYEYNEGCATDPAGNVYVSGATLSLSGIASAGAFQTTLNSLECYLVKFSPNGARLWGTYFGSYGQDNGGFCSTDPSGNVYLGGVTTSTSGIAFNGFQNSFVMNGAANPFLAKFNAAGQRIWATYYAGNSNTGGQSCCTDQAGCVFLTGSTQANAGIASGGMQNSSGGGVDAFIVKFDSAGNRIWGSYYGGNDYDFAGYSVTDRFGQLFFSGFTRSTSGIAKNGFQNVLNNGADAYLVKIGDTVTIFTDSLARLIYCAGDTILVPFHSYGLFTPGNIYTAELSDANGLFTAPWSIGSIASSNNIDTVIAVIPLTTKPGTLYHIRVTSNLPVAIGKDNREDITIHTVPAQPGAIAGSDTVCTGSTNVYRVVPIPDAVSYIWTLPATWSGSSTADSIVTVAGASGGIISVLAINSCGQSVPTSRVVVSGNYLVMPSVQIPRGIRCFGKANTFKTITKYAGTNPVFQWKKNGLNVGSNNATYFDSSLKTGDIISVVMTSNAPCISQAVVVSNDDTIVVGTPIYPGININSNPPIVLCDGTPIHFVTNIVAGGVAPSYQWYKNGILLPGATASTYIDSLLVHGDTMTVALFSSDDCPITQPTMSNVVGVAVYPKLPTAVSISASPDSIIRGLPVTFTATPVNAGPRPFYVWYLNSVPVPFDTTDTWTANNLTDDDVVKVRMTSSVQCPVPLSVTSPALTMRAYTTGVATASGNEHAIKIYPNPTNSSITLEIPDQAGAGTLTLSDALGRLVLSAPVAEIKNHYELSHLPAGVYVCRVMLSGGQYFIGKLVKR